MFAQFSLVNENYFREELAVEDLEGVATRKSEEFAHARNR
jgi:hypothetical protein